MLQYWVKEVSPVPAGNTVDLDLSELTHVADRKVLFTTMFNLFLISSLFKQLLYFTEHYKSNVSSSL